MRDKQQCRYLVGIGGLLLVLIFGAAHAAERSRGTQKSLATLSLTGVQPALKAGLEKHLPVNLPGCSASKSEVSDYFRSLKSSLRKGARALGYYDARFLSDGEYLNGCWRLSLGIDPGQPVRVVRQQIHVIGPGHVEPRFRQALRKMPYQQNDVLNHRLYTDFKDDLTEIAETLGYLDAAYEQKELKVDPVNYAASVSLVLNTGPRYRFGNVMVDQDVLTDRLMGRFIKIKPGTPFSTELVIDQQQILQASGYYSSVDVDVGIQEAKNGFIPVNIKLKRARRSKYLFKVGYGTDTGPRVKAELTRRWTGGKGRRIKSSAQWAQYLSKLSFELIEPRENPEFDKLTYAVNWVYDQGNDVTSNSLRFGSEYKRKVASGWEQAIFINMLLDRTTPDGGETDESVLTLAGGRLAKTETDNAGFASTGWRLNLKAQGAVNGVLSDQTVWQLHGSGKYIFPVGPGRMVNRLELGVTSGGALTELPKSLRFFAGGRESVRGYDFQSIGDVDSAGSVIGGKMLLAGGVEYEYPIRDGFSVAAFVDAGDAFDTLSDMNFSFGIGIGGRYRSPIGPVRIDLGFPTDDLSEVNFHLSVGPDL